ncbi:unnamed protein product [Ambrosiozyma monospora]|uniref:Unnamed protein product n=1 Tax=Ambrosiozyma monospora TaxID=43982 RepID=A0A9W6YWQ7_AMBMO|nr:unnamed protein product [Ambrosiozyma monospora]
MIGATLEYAMSSSSSVSMSVVDLLMSLRKPKSLVGDLECFDCKEVIVGNVKSGCCSKFMELGLDMLFGTENDFGILLNECLCDFVESERFKELVLLFMVPVTESEDGDWEPFLLCSSFLIVPAILLYWSCYMNTEIMIGIVICSRYGCF